MDGEKELNAAVEAAYEAETQETPTPEKVETPQVETPAEPENKVETPETPEQPAEPETPAVEEEKPAEEKPVEDTPAPQQLKGDFAKNKWAELDKETKDELSRLCVENERNYRRAAEAEYNAQTFREKIKPVQGYISEVAETAKITDAEVIRNCVDIVQNLNDKPDVTARQMIAGGLVRFNDPVAVIKEIARTYGVDLKGELREKDIPMSTQVDAARAKYEARQSRFVKQEDVDAEKAQIINDYITNTPSINALYTNESTRDKFIRQVSMERSADPYASDITIINRAAEMFAGAVQAPQPKVETPAEPKPTIAEQKMAKVVAPKPSNPADVPAKAPVEEWTFENNGRKSGQAAMESVRAAMRSLGLDD